MDACEKMYTDPIAKIFGQGGMRGYGVGISFAEHKKETVQTGSGFERPL